MNYMQSRPPMSLQTQEEKQMGLFIHLSQLLGLVFPVVGIILPVILWQTQKDRMPALDAHGKMVVNWMISCFIYAVVSIPLMFILIGIPMFLALMVISVVFPIVGGIKANQGELWEYPLTIKFLK